MIYSEKKFSFLYKEDIKGQTLILIIYNNYNFIIIFKTHMFKITFKKYYCG